MAVSALMAAAALAVAGCGGGPSKDEYTADFNEICKESNEKIQQIKPPRTIKEIAPFMRKSRVVLEDSLEEAEDLELPDENRDQFEAYIEANKKSLDVLDDIEQVAAKNDRAGVRRLFAKTTLENQKRDIQGKKLGLNECGSG